MSAWTGALRIATNQKPDSDLRYEQNRLEQNECELWLRTAKIQITLLERQQYLAAALATNISPMCPNVSAAKRVCTRPIDTHQLHCIVCTSGGGVDQHHSALARCLADLITTHTGAKVHIEQTIRGLPREPHPGAQPEGARMDIVSNLHGQTYYIDTAVASPFSANAGLLAATSGRPGFMAKREERIKFSRYPRINHIPFILETTGRPGFHAQKFIKHLFSDTDPSLPFTLPPPPPLPPYSHPRRLGRHPNHTPQLHLQTTTLRSYHVTTLPTDSLPFIPPPLFPPFAKVGTNFDPGARFNFFLYLISRGTCMMTIPMTSENFLFFDSSHPDDPSDTHEFS